MACVRGVAAHARHTLLLAAETRCSHAPPHARRAAPPSCQSTSPSRCCCAASRHHASDAADCGWKRLSPSGSALFRPIWSRCVLNALCSERAVYHPSTKPRACCMNMLACHHFLTHARCISRAFDTPLAACVLHHSSRDAAAAAAHELTHASPAQSVWLRPMPDVHQTNTPCLNNAACHSCKHISQGRT